MDETAGDAPATQRAIGEADRADVDPAAGARAVLSGRERCALLAVYMLLVALRLPRAWPHGRFVGEEGTVFLAYAWHRPAMDALWRSFGGYLNLAANAITLLDARLVRGGVLPLEWAPYLTMAAAMLVQALPAIILLTGRGRWLASRRAIAAALLGIAIAPRTEEVFLNVLHIQFHLALCVALILALEIPTSRRARLLYAALLFLAPLCGPSAIVLLPFFVLRAAMERDPARAMQAAILGAGAAIQLLFFFAPSPVRGHLLDPGTLSAVMFVRLVVLPLGSALAASIVGLSTWASYAAHGHGWWLASAGATLALGALLAVALRDRRDAAPWLVAPGLALAVVSFGGGMIAEKTSSLFDVPWGARYQFLPIVLLYLGLIAVARRWEGRWSRIPAGLCYVVLLSGAISYGSPVRELSSGANWRDEVAMWRRDHDHPLLTWPHEWLVDLSDRDRPCGDRMSAIAADPSYCEANWNTRYEQSSAKGTRAPQPVRADRPNH
jgi:hypothetical protein